MANDRERLLNLIEQAFDGVVLGDGVSLHETIVLDNYGDESERQAARKPDEKADWRKLVGDPELLKVSSIGGLAFYDAEGLRFHLPAYLCMTVKALDSAGASTWVMNELSYTLTDMSCYQLGRLSILNVAQRAAIREVMVFWRAKWEPHRKVTPERISGFDLAIDQIWNPQESMLDFPDRWHPDP